MSTVKISQLPFTPNVCSTALIPIVQDGITCATYACKLGSTVLVEGSGTASIQRNGFSNSASGIYSLVTQGLSNVAGNCFTTANGTNNIVCTGNSHILSGQMNVIACDALPNYNPLSSKLGCTFITASGGYYNGFTAGQTTLSSSYGDLTSYYTPGSTISSLYTYNDPQGLYINLTVCGSSYNAGTCVTTICVDPTVNTCSGYIIKTGTFSSYSAYHPNIIAGGSFNTINDYTSASTISGGYQNTVSGGYGTIGGGRYNYIYNGATISGGSSNVICTYGSFIGGGQSNAAIGSAICSVIGGGGQNTTCGPASVIGGGYNNCAFGDGSGILGGSFNVVPNSTSFIVGSNIITDRDCATFVNNLSIKNIPTSAAGLPAGAVWSNSGVLTIV